MKVGDRRRIDHKGVSYFGTLKSVGVNCWQIECADGTNIISPDAPKLPEYEFDFGKEYKLYCHQYNGNFATFKGVVVKSKYPQFNGDILDGGLQFGIQMDYIVSIELLNSLAEEDRCICDSFDVFNLGCKCGAFQREMEKRRAGNR